MTECSSGRTIAIGDIHGCVHALDAVLDALAPQVDDTLVILGDVVDQGRDTCQVIDRLIDLSSECQLICIQGNHEELLLAARNDEGLAEYWYDCGGLQTLNSYRFPGKMEDIPAEHIEFLQTFRNFFETDDFIFTHANYDPDLPMDQQDPRIMRWGLLTEEDCRAHQSGKPVVVGHTEQVSGEPLDLGFVKCIDTACYRYGWLTALDVESGQLWQASRFGALRQSDEQPVGQVSQ
jgi:serine/threonine protein phosphatase 1